jgi:hypothetical protein
MAGHGVRVYLGFQVPCCGQSSAPRKEKTDLATFDHPSFSLPPSSHTPPARLPAVLRACVSLSVTGEGRRQCPFVLSLFFTHTPSLPAPLKA